jgi:hypothetical protein
VIVYGSFAELLLHAGSSKQAKCRAKAAGAPESDYLSTRKGVFLKVFIIKAYETARHSRIVIAGP